MVEGADCPQAGGTDHFGLMVFAAEVHSSEIEVVLVLVVVHRIARGPIGGGGLARVVVGMVDWGGISTT